MKYSIDNAGFEHQIQVSDREISDCHLPLLRRFAQAADDGRAIVLLAGPPGSGKTLLCMFWQKLAERESLPLVSLSMDGFHYPNKYLKERDLLECKGSPETFDTRSMAIALAQIHAGTPATWPRYDRQTHEPVPDGVTVDDQKVVVVEGNYLLLDEPHWAALRRYATLTVRLDIDRRCLRRRLEERHMRVGRTRQQASAKFENDLRNIVLVQERSVEADIVLLRDGKGGFRLLTGGGRSL